MCARDWTLRKKRTTCLVSVFFTGNTIYGAGRRITSLVVAQDAGNKTQSLDRFGPLGRDNTLRPICGCVYLMLGCGELCFAVGCMLCDVLLWDSVVYGGAPACLIYSGSKVT